MRKARLAALKKRVQRMEEQMEAAKLDNRAVVAAVAKATHIKPENILGKRKKKKQVEARYISWYVLYKRGHQRARIEELFEAQHRSVTVGIKTISEQRKDERISRILEQVKGELRGKLG